MLCRGKWGDQDGDLSKNGSLEKIGIVTKVGRYRDAKRVVNGESPKPDKAGYQLWVRWYVLNSQIKTSMTENVLKILGQIEKYVMGNSKS